MRLRALLVVVCLCLLCPLAAQANSPRDYIPLEPGSGFLALYYNHAFADEAYTDGHKTTNNLDYNANVSIIRPVYYTELGPFEIDPQFLLPVGQAEIGNDQSSGLGDLTFGATVWFINNKQDKFIFAWTPFIIAPIGEYDANKRVNLGANRWATKQELCIVKGFGERTWLEVAGSVEFYGDNDDARDAAGNTVTRSQDVAFGSETHLSYDFTKDFFGSMDYYYHYDSETQLNSRVETESGSRHTIGGTAAYMLRPDVQLMANVNTDVAVESGIKQTVLGIRLGFIF